MVSRDFINKVDTVEPVLTSHERGVAPTRDDCLTEVKKQ